MRVVILGQDPYHGPGQAHGLSFSVPPGVDIPPSLLNIFKEIERDLGLPRPRHGNLESWAQQGVLLLNSVLTVEMAQAASHQRRGWERFTDSFFNARVMAQYLPKIIEGFGLTVVLALCIIAAGLAAGLGGRLLDSVLMRLLDAALLCTGAHSSFSVCSSCMKRYGQPVRPHQIAVFAEFAPDKHEFSGFSVHRQLDQ